MTRMMALALMLGASLAVSLPAAAQAPAKEQAPKAKAAAKPKGKAIVKRKGPAKKVVAKAKPKTKPGAKCVRAGGSANMITRDLAEFMAKAALKNSIAGMGRKPIGKITLTCKSGAPIYCLARQKACY